MCVGGLGPKTHTLMRDSCVTSPPYGCMTEFRGPYMDRHKGLPRGDPCRAHLGPFWPKVGQSEVRSGLSGQFPVPWWRQIPSSTHLDVFCYLLLSNCHVVCTYPAKLSSPNNFEYFYIFSHNFELFGFTLLAVPLFGLFPTIFHFLVSSLWPGAWP